MEYTIPVPCKLLRVGCDEEAEFEDVTIDVNLQDDTIGSFKRKLDVGGFIIYFGEILKEETRFRTFFDVKERLIVMACDPSFVELNSADTNPANRLVRAGFTITHALLALGRSIWHEGMDEFARSAHLIRRLIDEGALEDYQNRMESITFNDNGDLETVGAVNEFTEKEFTFLSEWGVDNGEHAPTELIDGHRPPGSRKELSEDAKEAQRSKRTAVMANRDILENASLAVVRMFGYHPLQSVPDIGPGGGDTSASPSLRNATQRVSSINLSSINVSTTSTGLDIAAVSAALQAESVTPVSPQKFRIVPFTGFFVAPTLIMATKNCNYSKQHATYAVQYRFTRRPRASYHFLRLGVDLFECTPVRGITSFLVDRIRHIGVEVPDEIIPPDNIATRWSDVMLFEVPEEYRSDHFLVPDLAPISGRDLLLTISYGTRPSPQWLQEALPTSHKGDSPTERDLQDHFFGYDAKCASVGLAKDDERDGTCPHMCCLLPSSVGSPIFRVGGDALAGAAMGGTAGNAHFATFVGINCGRSRTDVLSSEGPGGIAAVRRHNLCITVRHLAFVLVYQHYVAPRLTRDDSTKLIKRFLQPYKILTESERLTACHVKMLKDADEFNEYGMSFYEQQQLTYALHCFREGARMFSVANIPEQTEYDRKLKDALQSNVASVIMSLRETGQMLSS
eukprot:TRINITY_DN15783_c0_g6_i1.p1 TRINITY_DN15783_c0_g6~~TRINITY_DN15783_c0_g6_i1.p1  ORF type:complete len:679 (-),score=94.09 TRINITY_DN15783_c0_g6_i1:13-2049(-)